MTAGAQATFAAGGCASAAEPRPLPQFFGRGPRAADRGIIGRCLPWLLLVVALSAVFAFSGDRAHFYRPYLSHNWDSAKNLAIAQNLSLRHGLRLFVRQHLGADGETGYEVYSRFPVSAYALVKLALLPFDSDLAAKTLAARMLMLALFCAAALLACAALRHIAGDHWIALTATLLSFSSFYMLYYSDSVSVQMATDLFGMMLVFHGMVVFAKQGRFRQLAAKACAALLLGWHVYALLLAFIVLGLCGDAAGAWARAGRPLRAFEWRRLRTASLALVRSRFLMLGVIALLFGSVVLGFNFGNEYAALEGETPFGELPSVRSFLYRTGQDAEFSAGLAEQLAWPSFLFRQIHSVGAAAIPYALPVARDARGRLQRKGPTGILIAGLGTIAIGACLVSLLVLRIPNRDKMLLGALAASSFVWTLAMRHNVAGHDFEHLFYFVLPLAAFTLALMGLRRRFGGRPIVGAALVAAALFAVSASEASRLPTDPQKTALARELAADFGRMRGMTRGKTVFVADEGHLPTAFPLAAGPYLTAYYLSGSFLQYDVTGHWPFFSYSLMHRNGAYDFILSHARVEHPSLLTPDNRFAFLYDGGSFAKAHDYYAASYRAEYDAVALGEPAANGEFDVYLRGRDDQGNREMVFLKHPCAAEDAQGFFFVHVVPAQTTSLPPSRRAHGFDNLDFRFADRGVVFDSRCMANLPLPSYRMATIAAGRIGTDGALAWQVEIEIDAAPRPGPQSS